MRIAQSSSFGVDELHEGNMHGILRLVNLKD